MTSNKNVISKYNKICHGRLAHLVKSQDINKVVDSNSVVDVRISLMSGL